MILNRPVTTQKRKISTLQGIPTHRLICSWSVRLPMCLSILMRDWQGVCRSQMGCSSPIPSEVLALQSFDDVTRSVDGLTAVYTGGYELQYIWAVCLDIMFGTQLCQGSVPA